jgi:hypothetical protein
MLVTIVLVSVGILVGLMTAGGGFLRTWGRGSGQLLVAPKGAGFGVASRLVRQELERGVRDGAAELGLGAAGS